MCLIDAPFERNQIEVNIKWILNPKYSFLNRLHVSFHTINFEIEIYVTLLNSANNDDRQKKDETTVRKTNERSIKSNSLETRKSLILTVTRRKTEEEEKKLRELKHTC